MKSSGVPGAVLDAYGFRDESISPIAGGLINQTFLALDAGGRGRAVLQKLHEIFAPEVNVDIDAVTAHLEKAGIETPRLIRTESGERWVEESGSVWRALTYVEGTSVDRLANAAQAEAAGELVGRFHAALDDFDYTFVSVRIGVHDTAAHLARLESAIASSGDDFEERDQAIELGVAILERARALPTLGDLPERVTHGDLKISNLIFSSLEPPRARCLVDLDTMGVQTIAYELGDAFRSWCNPRGENTLTPTFSIELFEAAMRGYKRGAPGLLSPAEEASIRPGIETVCVELAARFAADIFEDSYFGWDPSRFPSRRAQNLLRAHCQLALGDRANFETC